MGPGSLTGRERQVARLAAQGLTVRQIGERLFIGERTVESHLARAYAKLGVSSKADLVARIRARALSEIRTFPGSPGVCSSVPSSRDLVAPLAAHPAATGRSPWELHARGNRVPGRRRDRIYRPPSKERQPCAITAWHISHGYVTGVDVSGLTLVAVGRRDAGSARRVLFLDEGARPEQVRPLLDLFRGRLGVSWAGLAAADQDAGAYQVPIEVDGSGVNVQDRLHLGLGHEAGELWVEIPELELTWRSSRCPVASAHFLVEDVC